MPKVNGYIRDVHYPALLERVQEEGISVNSFVTEAVMEKLALTDPKTRKPKDRWANTVKACTYLPVDWWENLNWRAVEGKTTLANLLREAAQAHYGYPDPPKVEKAPRDKSLDHDVRMAHDIDTFGGTDELRKVRSQEKKPEDMKVWDRIRAFPHEWFLVCFCGVKGCYDDTLGLHRHPGNMLIEYADKREAGGPT